MNSQRVWVTWVVVRSYANLPSENVVLKEYRILVYGSSCEYYLDETMKLYLNAFTADQPRCVQGSICAVFIILCL